MTTTAVSDYSSDSVRYYRHYFQDRAAEAPATDTEDDQEKDSNKKKSGERLPRIVLRNKLGKELDTFTTLQEAIYRAKRNVRDSMQATQPEEWRLPNAPLPSRPDFSRAVPSITELRKRRKAKQQKTAKSTPSLPYDVDVDDVGFVAESLQHLPKVPSLSFLRQDLLAEPKRYFPFVQSMLLFKKFLSETDKRDHVYNFPGFCTGCQRMGLCYGCERSLEPHYHMDQPVKTGGGFTFYKRERPEHELKHRHPSNWRYTFPELAKRGAEGETTLEDRQYKDNMSEEDEGILVDKITPEEEELLGMKPSESTSQSTKRSKPSSPSTKRSKLSSRSTKISGLDGDDEMYSAGTGSEVRGDTAHTGSKGKRVYIVEGLKHLDGKSSGTGDGTYTDQSTDYDDDDEIGEGSQLRKSRRKLRTRRTRDGTQSDEEDDDRSHDRSHSQSKSPFSRSSSEKRRLYKAPAPFKIKKKSRKIVASVSPFSSNRKYNLPKGDGFKVKKSGKSPTQIKEFKQHEGDWKAPKQFEVKKSDKKSTDFWSPPPQKEKPKPVKIKRESPKKVQHPPSPDSGLESEKMTDVPEPPPPPVTMETDQQRETTPAAQTKPSSPEKIKKEKPKKTKKEKVKDEPKPPPTPPPPVVERSMSPDTPLPQLPSDADTEVAMATPTPEPTKEVPELPSFDIPALPEIKDEKKTKVDDRRTQLIQSVPKMKEVKEALPKKKFMPKVTKKSMPKRRRSSAKAPVTPEELKQMTDPLDFLAKYCIINKDRLPYYDRIYHNIVSNQTPKYERIHDTHASISGSASFPVLADHEMNMLHDMTVINRAQEPARIGLSVPEQYLEKICYTLDFLEQKQNKMSLDLHNLETEKIKKLAEKAKELNPHIIRPDFQVKPSKKASKKKKKKKGKGKEEKADSDEEAPPEKLTAADITDRIIVDRIDDKTLNSLCKQPDIHQLDLEMDRIAQKVSDIDERIEHLENEKNLLGIYCMEYFFRDQGRNKKPTEFRRQQSSLYNKLHPDPDIEMNMEELEGALQVINHSLLTEKEFEYLFNVLNLPGRLKINFQLFAVIAALSEKVTQLDPVIRKLLNKVDYGALNVKMDRSRELFELLDDGTITPSGNAPADSLAVELRAGGLSVEHTNYVLSKFNRNGNGFIDFLDFVTYVPLFVEIHEKIVKDPFNVQLFV